MPARDGEAYGTASTAADMQQCWLQVVHLYCPVVPLLGVLNPPSPCTSHATSSLDIDAPEACPKPAGVMCQTDSCIIAFDQPGLAVYWTPTPQHALHPCAMRHKHEAIRLFSYLLKAGTCVCGPPGASWSISKPPSAVVQSLVR